MQRHAESDNRVLLAVLPESKQVMALMAINNKQTILFNYTLLCMPVKVLQRFKTKVICTLAILWDFNSPVMR
jgi:hypothetical protein